MLYKNRLTKVPDIPKSDKNQNEIVVKFSRENLFATLHATIPSELYCHYHKYLSLNFDLDFTASTSSGFTMPVFLILLIVTLRF